jgi:predicted DNA-binding WGR domain protein
MTQRFEHTDRTSRKFWEVTVRGSAVTVRYGRMGSDGQTQRTEYADRAAARSAAATRIAEKVRKGYREIGSAEAPAAAGTGDTKQLDRVRKLLGQSTIAAVRRGIALARTLNDHDLWTALADGCTSSKGELLRHVKAEFRDEVSLAVRCGAGYLAAEEELMLQNYETLTTLDCLHNLPALRELSIECCHQLKSLDGLQRLPALRELRIERCARLRTLDGLQHLTGLEDLVIDEGHFKNLDAISGLSTLRGLHLITGVTISDRHWTRVFSGLRGLRSLTLEEGVQPPSLDVLRPLTSLEGLRLEDRYDLTGLSPLPALKNLSLWGCHLDNLDGISGLPALESLQIRACDLESLDGLRDLPALRTVKIEQVSNLTSFAAINNLPALHTLDLKACESAPKKVRAVLRGQRLAAFKATLKRA